MGSNLYTVGQGLSAPGFDEDQYTVKTCVLDGQAVTYRAFEGIEYCLNPCDPIQKLNIFVPEDYYTGAVHNGYTLHTAPIFMPNTVGGYMPGPSDFPGYDHKGRINSIFRALEHGYVVVSAGIRGRTSGKVSHEFFEGSILAGSEPNLGKTVGKAPALIVDYKAAIRYLRHNKARIPGDTDHIITNGTSAGGALSALAGATGNSEDYEPYLKEIGAADEADNIFAASCYCPIHNLENADSAYEWQFEDCYDFHRTKHVRTDKGLERVPYDGVMDESQKKVSGMLKKLFPPYLNSLCLKAPDGTELKLDDSGQGSFLDYVKSFVEKAAERELKLNESPSRLQAMDADEHPVKDQPFINIDESGKVSVDWKCYIRTITRMKAAPAFDALDLSSPENDEFGIPGIVGPDNKTDARHFSKFSYENSTVRGELAEPDLVRMLNPVRYIGSEGTAQYWRIRHGSFDRDTSLAIPVILAARLENLGYSVDFALPWGLPHSGDYDLEELFSWIDNIVAEDRRK